MIRFLLSLSLLLLFVSPDSVAGSFGRSEEKAPEVESIGEAKSESLSEAVRGALQAKGLRVTDAGGKTLCEMWFRREIADGKAENADASFSQLQEGSFIGVVNFPTATSDYRGQGIKAGWYTLRYVIMPVNGAHLGVSPTRDFLLLCPISEDKDPDKVIRGADLIKLSMAASGSGHVSPWSLVAPAAKEGFPRIEMTDEGHVILEVSLKTKSGTLPIGITIVGKTEG